VSRNETSKRSGNSPHGRSSHGVTRWPRTISTRGTAAHISEMHDLQTGRAQVGAVLGDRYVEHELRSPLDVLYRRADLGPRATKREAALEAVARR
jgi:hypothetical protein